MLLALLVACGSSDEPVVRAVRPIPPTVEQVAEKREREELRTSPRNLEVNYSKPDGVYIDAHFLGGRRWDNVREIVVEQLGELQTDVQRTERVRVVTLERGTLTLKDGVIDILDIPLPEPMRRAEAMVACGFSGLADRYLALSREFRVTQFQGYRRVVLHRVERGSEDIKRVTAYKLQEHEGEVPD